MATGLFSNIAYADEKPCHVTLCLLGKMNGSSGGDCNQQERRFFDIVKKKHGSFLPTQTFDARKDFLKEECPASYGASAFVDKILDKFGRLRG